MKKKYISNEFRLIISNFLSLAVLKMVSTIVPFIALPYLIKTIGYSNYGIVVLGLSITTYFINIGVYGYAVSGVRDISKNSSSLLKMSYIVSTALSTQILLLLSCTSFYLLLLFFEQIRLQLSVYLLLIPYLWCESLFPSWFFQGIQKMKYITIISSLVKILFTISVFVFIKSAQDYWIYPLTLSLGSILSLFMALFFIKKEGVHIKIRYNFSKITKEIKNNFVIFMSDVAPMLYNNTTQVLLGLVVSPALLGVFDAIRKIITIVSVFLKVISNSIFPFFNKNRDKFKKYYRYVLLLCILVICGAFTFYPFFFKLFSIENSNINISVLILLLFGQLGTTVSMIFGMNYLIVIRKENLVFKATLYASLLGFVMAYPLIRYFGILGGAYTISVSQMFLGTITYYFYRKQNV